MADRKDPYRNMRFLMEIDGITQAGFQEVTIPDVTQDPIEYRNGDEGPTVRKIPGLVKYGNVTLKWGVTDDSISLFEWRKQVMDGNTKEARRNMAVVVLDEMGEAKGRWEFTAAWPTKYDAPDLNATGNEIAIETLEIAHEGMQRTA